MLFILPSSYFYGVLDVPFKLHAQSPVAS